MSEYKTFIYNLCSETDLDDREDVVDAMMVLGREAIKYHKLVLQYEDKLKELMSYKDFMDWSNERAKDMLKDTVESFPEGELKDALKGFVTHLEECEENDE